MSSNSIQQDEAQRNEIKKLQKECADLREKWKNSLDYNSKLNQENNRALEDWIVQKKQMENLERKNKTLLIELELSERENDALQQQQQDLQRSSAKMEQHRIIQIQSLIEQTKDYENKLKELRKKNNEKAAYIRKQAGEIKQLQRMQIMNNNSQNQIPILITALPPNLEADGPIYGDQRLLRTKDISKELYQKEKLDEIDQFKEAKEEYEEKELLHNNRLIVIGKKRTSKEAELKLEDDDRTTKKFK